MAPSECFLDGASKWSLTDKLAMSLTGPRSPTASPDKARYTNQSWPHTLSTNMPSDE